ncbi:SDR family NAD(P)-dependent oxidoreductase [Pseudomonas sp. Ant30-3]|uniref:SDR family NAD(P)-dependent oxidoreductase n=1 Tax=Pseudomonas sp. Ant30-3 TaxID=1488328 RepID=UPI00048F308A|nr:SDR family oxidoreductase [Pseudomonas sp. Ant30-3]
MSLTPPRRYWLTGAGNGIGAALAEEILKTGASLAVSSRLVAPLKTLSQRYPRQVLMLAGDLTSAQTVREIGEQIAREWGSLDSVILNAGTCEYVDVQQFDATIVEHVVRTNLLACSYCIEAALPLLRAGTAPHLVGIASPVTSLALPGAEAHGRAKPGLQHLFESMRIKLAPSEIEVTFVSPGSFPTPATTADDSPLSLRWPAGKAARHIFAELKHRPLNIAFPALFMAALWPLEKITNRPQLAIGKRIVRKHPPILDRL